MNKKIVSYVFIVPQEKRVFAPQGFLKIVQIDTGDDHYINVVDEDDFIVSKEFDSFDSAFDFVQAIPQYLKSIDWLFDNGFHP